MRIFRNRKLVVSVAVESERVGHKKIPSGTMLKAKFLLKTKWNFPIFASLITATHKEKKSTGVLWYESRYRICLVCAVVYCDIHFVFMRINKSKQFFIKRHDLWKWVLCARFIFV